MGVENLRIIRKNRAGNYNLDEVNNEVDFYNRGISSNVINCFY